jgi:ORF6N domain
MPEEAVHRSSRFMKSDALALQVERRVYLIRGQKVILDSELAELYGVETKALNKAVKRNANRFRTILCSG